MVNDVQKNFRKQMKEYQKELNKKKDDGFYSYIERDHIKSYYQKRRKRRVIISASIIGLLVLLWNSYAIYTWFNPLYYSLTGKNLPTIGRMVDLRGNKQREVAQYLNSISTIGEMERTWLEYGTSNLIEALENKIDRNEYFKRIEEYSSQIEQELLRVEAIDPPDVMVNYHGMIIKKLIICDQIFDETMKIKSTRDVERINKCIKDTNQLIYKYNETAKRSRDELINLFNEIGMEYNVDNEKIHYRWEE